MNRNDVAEWYTSVAHIVEERVRRDTKEERKEGARQLGLLLESLPGNKFMSPELLNVCEKALEIIKESDCYLHGEADIKALSDMIKRRRARIALIDSQSVGLF